MTTHDYEQPASQAERRAMLKQDAAARDVPTSYFAREAANDAAEGGPAPVVGASAKPYGADLPAPTWAHDPSGKEPPLGEDVNALVDMRACWWREGAVAPGEEPTDEEA